MPRKIPDSSWSKIWAPSADILASGLDCGWNRYWTNLKFQSGCWFSSRVCISVVMNIDVVSSEK